MRNMPKVIGTGKDIYNLLGMVQAGTLEAAELREVINGIEEEKYIFAPNTRQRMTVPKII